MVFEFPMTGVLSVFLPVAPDDPAHAPSGGNGSASLAGGSMSERRAGSFPSRRRTPNGAIAHFQEA
jgi:hypothetical protein